MRIKAAAKELRVSYRQGQRIYAAYEGGGDAALVHGNFGKPSKRKIEAAVREAALSAYRERYSDFGPAFAAEKLAEVEEVKISDETLRRWLVEAGLWKVRRKKQEHRSRRERRQCFGELVQFDGSHHRWFEERGLVCCLITMIDDATNVSMHNFLTGRRQPVR